jgi:hypothetical protein
MRLSLKESRRKLLKAANFDRKSGIRGPKKMGEALSIALCSRPESIPKLMVVDPDRRDLSMKNQW